MHRILGAVIGGINQRKGTIVDTEIREEEFSLVCEVSLNEMFGCECNRSSNWLRRADQSPSLLRCRCFANPWHDSG